MCDVDLSKWWPVNVPTRSEVLAVLGVKLSLCAQRGGCEGLCGANCGISHSIVSCGNDERFYQPFDNSCVVNYDVMVVFINHSILSMCGYGLTM